MTRLAALMGASLLALAAPAMAQEAVIAVPPLEFTHRELANGLDVYAMPDATAGTVTVQLWYDVGGKDDPEGRSGFAHLFEHILSRKTVNLPYGQISTIVENAGGTRNASTGQDTTNYYETVPPEYLETMLWTHAERMARPVVDEAVFEAERSIVKEELRQRVLAPPYGRLNFIIVGDNEYDQSIYRRGVIGSIEQLDSARLDDARAFHEAYYRPATATLVVSGNFDPAQLDRWVDQYFADIANPERPVPVMTRPVSPPRTQPRRVEAYAPNVPLPAIAAIYPGVKAADADAAPLEVMQAVLSRGQSSRLYQALVYRGQLASNVNAGLDALEEDGSFTVQATTAQGKTVEALEAALDAELARMRDTPVSEAELAEAKTEILAAALRGRETSSGRAFLLGRGVIDEHDPAAADKQLAAIQQVTAADVQRVARAYLDDNARVSVVYRDEAERPQGTPEDGWRNPAPTPTFVTVPPAILPANELLPEGRRMAPPAPGAARPIQAPDVQERTLDNGLRVIAAKSTDLPIFNAQLIIDGGATSDPQDKAGLASMTASLATQGAGGRTAPEIAATLERLGANLNGGAGDDASVLALSAPIAVAEEAGAVFADVVMRPDYPQAELDRSRTRQINALRVNLRQPGPLANAVLARVAYGTADSGMAGYGASTTPESLGRLTRENVTRYRDLWWRSSNATLVITGGMSADEAFAFAERTFGDWRAPDGPTLLPVDKFVEPTRRRVVVIDLPGAGQAAVAAAVRAPSRHSPDWYPLAVTNAVIGGGQNGHLFQEVRAKRGLSYGAYSSLSPKANGGLLTATTQTKNESAAEVVALVLAEFDRLATEPVTDQAARDRATYVSGNFTRNLETTGGLGGVLAEAVTLGLTPDEALAFPEQVMATTPEAISGVAREIRSTEAYVVVVGQSDMFVDALREAHPDLVVIPAAELDLNSPTLGLLEVRIRQAD